jgi:hypothetical protein
MSWRDSYDLLGELIDRLVDLFPWAGSCAPLVASAVTTVALLVTLTASAWMWILRVRLLSRQNEKLRLEILEMQRRLAQQIAQAKAEAASQVRTASPADYTEAVRMYDQMQTARRSTSSDSQMSASLSMPRYPSSIRSGAPTGGGGVDILELLVWIFMLPIRLALVLLLALAFVAMLLVHILVIIPFRSIVLALKLRPMARALAQDNRALRGARSRLREVERLLSEPGAAGWSSLADRSARRGR